MKIDEKDIIFAVYRYGNRTGVICHPDGDGEENNLYGAFSFIAAHQKGFLDLLKGVVVNAEKNGEKIRELARRQEMEGKLARIDKDKIKS